YFRGSGQAEQLGGDGFVPGQNSPVASNATTVTLTEGPPRRTLGQFPHLFAHPLLPAPGSSVGPDDLAIPDDAGSTPAALGLAGRGRAAPDPSRAAGGVRDARPWGGQVGRGRRLRHPDHRGTVPAVATQPEPGARQPARLRVLRDR